MSIYNISAGHNPAGKTACGAKGFLDESKEDRLITKEILKILKASGHEVHDCTCNHGISQGDVLQKIIAKCNQREVLLDISIHLNSGRNDKKGDEKIAGTEIWCTSASGIKKTVSERILKNMEGLGFTNLGVKTTNGLYYLNHTKNKAILIEVCFVDDKDDYILYQKLGYQKIAKAIAEGIMGKDAGKTEKPNYTAIKKTSSKTAVQWLQKKLNVCYTGKLPKLLVDGIWGENTQKILEAYWMQLGWKKGSYAGKKTCKALYKNRKR